MKTYKWTEQQKKALRGSIRKWSMISKGKGYDEGRENCPCCMIWHHPEEGEKDRECVGCPIMEFTGKYGCANTPYSYWYDNVGEDQDERRLAEYDSHFETAKAELNFLRAVYLAGGGK